MTRFILALGLFLLNTTISFSLWATTLTVSDNLIVSHINNKIVDHGFLNHTTKFSLKPGQYVLVIHYKDVFEDLNFAEDRVVKSKDFVVKLLVDQQKTLSLKTSTIKNLAQSEAFSKSPTLILTDENNQELPIELESVADYKIAEQVESAISSYTNQQAINHDKKAIISKVQSLSQTTIPTTPPTTTNDLNNKLIQINALPMLKYWWQNASEEEKKHFKKFINTMD